MFPEGMSEMLFARLAWSLITGVVRQVDVNR
jgi:hypothetical protein